MLAIHRFQQSQLCFVFSDCIGVSLHGRDAKGIQRDWTGRFGQFYSPEAIGHFGGCEVITCTSLSLDWIGRTVKSRRDDLGKKLITVKWGTGTAILQTTSSCWLFGVKSSFEADASWHLASLLAVCSIFCRWFQSAGHVMVRAKCLIYRVYCTDLSTFCGSTLMFRWSMLKPSYIWVW